MVVYVSDIPTNRSSIEFVTVLPVWTGFRDGSSNKIFKTTDYGDALSKSNNPASLSRVIRTSDISFASMFSETAFEFPEPPNEPSRAPSARKTRKRGSVIRGKGKPEK